MKQNRLKSWVVWTAVLAQLIAILLVTNTIAPEMAETIRAAVTSILEILVLFGILNNPTSKDRP